MHAAVLTHRRFRDLPLALVARDRGAVATTAKPSRLERLATAGTRPAAARAPAPAPAQARTALSGGLRCARSCGANEGRAPSWRWRRTPSGSGNAAEAIGGTTAGDASEESEEDTDASATSKDEAEPEEGDGTGATTAAASATTPPATFIQLNDATYQVSE